MMTWHTRFSFARTAEDLEDEHLRAQIMDAATIVDMMDANEKPSDPAYYMWIGYKEALLIMGMIFCFEWSFHRRYDDKMFWKFSREADRMSAAGEFTYEPPPWFRDRDVCFSHRSALIREAGEGAYEELWPSAPKGVPALFPVPDGAVYDLRVARADLPAVRRKELKIPKSIKERITNL